MDQRPYHFGMTRSSGVDAPPRIGLTTYREPAAWGVWNEPADLLPASYTDAVRAAGGVALLLPPGAADPSRDAAAALHGIHGLVLAGGADVDPARYGADRRPADRARRDRTATNGSSRWRARHFSADLPLLAICRGMQVLNVALGGDLVQHLPDLRRQRPCTARSSASTAGTRSSSRPAAASARCSVTAATVATYHHQAVDRARRRPDRHRLGRRRRRSRRVEHARADWVVGVQWHPEVHDGAAAVRRLRGRVPRTTDRGGR